MTQRIALFGGSFNPPGIHHRRLAIALAKEFDRVIIVPCGPRPDKRVTDRISPSHRATMCDLAFGDIPGVEVDLFDLEQASFTRTHDLDARYASQGDTFHIVGSDLVQGGAVVASKIQCEWEEADMIWRDLRWVVVRRDGYPCSEADLPPQGRFSIAMDDGASGSSTEIRGLAYNGQPFTHLLPGNVAEYVMRYNLYLGAIPPSATLLPAKEPKLILFVDELNARARKCAEAYRQFESAPEEANAILAIGGDGTMHRAVRQFWRKRLPFIGLNAGDKGYLLNELCDALPQRLCGDLVAHRHFLLYVEVVTETGVVTTHYAFNDAWLERSSRQTGHFEIKVDGRVRIPKLVADAALMATPAGSTAYARNMGATPLLNGAEGCIIAGGCVQSPRGWSAAPISFDSVVEITALNTHRRPARACFDDDGVDQAHHMKVRVSRIASVELAFLPERDMNAKLADDLFPA